PLSISSWSHFSASASLSTSRAFLTSLFLPVAGSFVRPRTRYPPSFLLKTPGTFVGLIQLFHLSVHFCSVMFASRTRRRRTGASDRECTSAQERVEVLAPPHPCARTAPAAGGHDAALVGCLPERARCLEPAVPGRIDRRQVRRPGAGGQRGLRLGRGRDVVALFGSRLRSGSDRSRRCSAGKRSVLHGCEAQGLPSDGRQRFQERRAARASPQKKTPGAYTARRGPVLHGKCRILKETTVIR